MSDDPKVPPRVIDAIEDMLIPAVDLTPEQKVRFEAAAERALARRRKAQP